MKVPTSLIFWSLLQFFIPNPIFSKTNVKNFPINFGLSSIDTLPTPSNPSNKTHYMAEIIVNGSSSASEIRKNTIPMVFIDQKYLVRKCGSTNIIDAIATVPGVSAVTTGPNISKPFIHGLGYNRVLTVVDGIRHEEQQWGDEHAVQIDQNGIDFAEVIKGPLSLIYGPDALAGVISFHSPIPLAPGKILGNLSYIFQSNTGLQGTSFRIQGNQKGWIWNGIFSGKIAKNYKNALDGRVWNTGYFEKDAKLMIGVSRSWGYSYLTASLYDDLQEVPDGSRDSLSRKFTKQITEIDTLRPIVSDNELNQYKISLLHQHIEFYQIYNNSRISIGKGNLEANLGYQLSRRREYSHPEYPTTPGQNLHLHSLTLNANYSFSILGFDTHFGINSMFQKNDIHNSSTFIIPNYHLFEWGQFLVVKRSIGSVEHPLNLSLGLRHDQRAFTTLEAYTKASLLTGIDRQVFEEDTLGATKVFNSLSKTFSGISGSLGISYNLGKNMAIKGNLSRGFRAPSIAEISNNGFNQGSFAYQIGNESFTPEYSFQKDISLEINHPFFSLNTEIYHNEIDGYIFNQKLQGYNGSDSVVVQGLPTFKFQQSKAILFGGDFYLDIHPKNWIHFENSLTLTYGNHSEDRTDSTRYLPFISPLHTTSSIRFEWKHLGKNIKNAYGKIEIQHYAMQDRFFGAYGTETATSGYNLLEVSFGGDFINKNGKPILKLFLEGSNLTDQVYQSHLSRLKYFETYANYPKPGIFNIGRNIAIRVIIPIFEKN